MNLVAVIAFLGFVGVASAAPQSDQRRPEDPIPIDTVTTCGGYIDTTSVSIEFQLGGSISADTRCVWVIWGRDQFHRFNLVSSGLQETDGIFLAGYSGNGFGEQHRLTTIGQNVSLSFRMALLTLHVGHEPTQGFKVEFYSSSGPNYEPLTGHALLTEAKGNYSYPVNGSEYGNSENALFVIAPTVPGQPTLRFSRVDVENEDTGCMYDSVRIFSWFDSDYLEVARFCGNTIPPSVTFQDGLGLITFVTDTTITGTGFDFEYE